VKPAPKPVAKAAPKIQDLNKANEVQLFSVPGIDRTLARMIVENRPFKDLEDFKSRKCGNSLLVTPENFKKMEKYVVVKTS
jgi:DNA uptake protein ComE-like DNA-binding protein